MIVFNLPAIIVAVLIGIVYWLVSLLIPDSWLQTDDNNVFVVLVVGSVVSIITEFVGLKGRVFWLPMWLFGLVGTAIVSFGKWGWWGPIGMAVIGGAVFGGLILLGRKAEMKEWENAPNSLAELQRQFAAGTHTKEFWEALQTAFFKPSWMKYTAEVCQHNLIVMDVLDKTEGLDDESNSAIDKYRALAEEGTQQREKPIKIPGEVEDGISKIIEKRLEYFEEKD